MIWPKFTEYLQFETSSVNNEENFKLSNESISSLSNFLELFPIEVASVAFSNARLTNWFYHEYFLSVSPVSINYLVIIMYVITLQRTY